MCTLQVGDEYRSMAGVIGQSKKLITKYARREFTDKVGGKPNQLFPIYFITYIFSGSYHLCPRLLLCSGAIYFEEESIS